jgi:hypothetical protein
MNFLENKIKIITEKIEAIDQKIDESHLFKQILSESSSEKCSREMAEAIRFVFNINPQVKFIFRYKIEKILEDLYPDNFYKKDEYGPGQMSGIYDLDGSGRSVINKLNTNYYCFCILLNDVNKVLTHLGKPNINIIGLKPFEQISETNKFVRILDEYKTRIFSPNSGTFKNLMTTLGITHTAGDETEDYTVSVLNKKFGENNVERIGELGNKEDMLDGIDCKISVNGKINTAQIKPFRSVVRKDDQISILKTGQVKRYSTDWLIFSKTNGEVLIFDNNNVKIVDGNYVFLKDDLIYSLG